MKLSIVIPVYRVEATLERCLKSVLGQTFTDLEVILVDDGSPDRCPAMCDEWAQRDHRVKVVHKPNGGLSDARNAGLEIASGEIVTFVDSDDYLQEDTYEKALPLMLDADIVEFPVYLHYGSSRQQLLSFEQRAYDDMEDYWLHCRAYQHAYAWNKLYRRELFNEVRYPVGQVFEDLPTLTLLLQHAKRVVTAHEGLYYYCANQQGITATATGNELKLLLDAHIEAMCHWCDSAYYMHVLNIQIDVYEMAGLQPTLPLRRISPLCKGLSPSSKLKATALNLLGIKRLCKLNKLTHQLSPRCS